MKMISIYWGAFETLYFGPDTHLIERINIFMQIRLKFNKSLVYITTRFRSFLIDYVKFWLVNIAPLNKYVKQHFFLLKMHLETFQKFK